MTAESVDSVTVLQQAITEKRHDWSRRIGSRTNLRPASSDRDFSEPILYERSGLASYEAALRAGSLNKSRILMMRALADYERAKGFYSEGQSPEALARKARCQAEITQIDYWFSNNTPLKKKLINESWKQARKALEGFEKIGERLEYGRTFNQFSTIPFLAASFSTRFKDSLSILKGAVDAGEKAVEYLENTSDSTELERAVVKTAAFLCWLTEYVEDSTEKESCLWKAREYWERAKTFSSDPALIGGATPEIYSLYQVMTPEETLRYTRNALKHSRETGDRIGIGTALDCLVCLEWDEHLSGARDQNERLKLSTQALEHSAEAGDQYDLIGFTSPLCFRESLWSGAPFAEYYRGLGQDVEVDPRKRREHLRKALEEAPRMLKLARASGYWRALQASHRVSSRILVALAATDHDPHGKQRLLRRALREMEECVGWSRRANPWSYFSNASDLADLSEINDRLAELSDNPSHKLRLVRAAVRQQETGVRLSEKDAQRYEKLGWTYFTANLGRWQYHYASLLGRLAALTESRNDIQSIIQVAEGAAETFRKLDQRNRVAECWWRIAEAQEALGDHSAAAKSFLTASTSYESASEQTPELSDYFKDYAAYMKGWSETEEARNAQELREHHSAGQHYEKAAALLQNTEWSYLAPGFQALGKIELGEDLSLKGLSREAFLVFREAEGLLRNFNEDHDYHPNPSRRKSTEIVTVRLSRLRRKYCEGRALLEEAKVLNKIADYSTAGAKCERASEILRQLSSSPELTNQERREMRLAASLSIAWGTMAKADGSSSPELFLKASRLFENAAKLSLSPSDNLLALGHGLLCTGLGVGTQFAVTGDLKLRSKAIQYLEGASSYYLKVGMENHSENTEAVKLVLDGYMYAGQAAKETDYVKRVAISDMAEKVLRQAAELFETTGYKGKREEVLRLLDRTVKRRDLDLSLTDVTGIPAVTSIATPLNLAGLFREKPVGLENFEHAELRANLDVVPQNTPEGQRFDLTLTITNTGSSPAKLMRLEGFVPQDCELVEGPSDYPVRSGRLDLMGKQLEQMQTEQVRLVLRPKIQGLFSLEPSILYMDESGSQRSCLLESQELVASPVLDFLVKSFLEDHEGKKLAPEHAGWRSLMEIVRSLRIPRSRVYGDSRRRHFLAPSIDRLVRIGLVETRVFPKERGRGGLITKLRLEYSSSAGRKLADRSPQVMGNL